MMMKTLLRIRDDVDYMLDGLYWLAVAILFTLWAGWQFGWSRVLDFYCIIFTTPIIILTTSLWIVNTVYRVYYPKKKMNARMLKEERRRADILEKEAVFSGAYIRTLKKEIAKLKFQIVKERKTIYKPFSEYNEEI